MKNERNRVTVSTDVLGFFADPGTVQSLYARAGFDCDLELVLMPFQYAILESLSRGYHVPGVRVGGVHGQLGAGDPGANPKGILDWLVVSAADILLPPVMGYRGFMPVLPAGLRVDMAGLCTGHDMYFNVHNDIVGSRQDEYLTYAGMAAYSHLTIENGGSPDDLGHTRDLVNQFRDRGAHRTTGTFDLVHAVVAASEHNICLSAVIRHWNTVLDQITPEFRHLHLPIGINNDSLPVVDMLAEKHMLTDLADVVKSTGISVTFENQHSLLFGAGSHRAEIDRLTMIRAGLLACGFSI